MSAPGTFVEDWNKALATLPSHLQEGIRAYVEEYRPVGSFLEAVFSGELYEACSRADPNSARSLVNIVQVILLFAPWESYGSPAHYRAWVARGDTPAAPAS